MNQISPKLLQVVFNKCQMPYAALHTACVLVIGRTVDSEPAEAAEAGTQPVHIQSLVSVISEHLSWQGRLVAPMCPRAPAPTHQLSK